MRSLNFFALLILLLIEPNHGTATLSSQILTRIEEVQSFPGLPQDSVLELKGHIKTLWDTLDKEYAIEIRGKDQDLRPSFVALQALVEEFLSKELGRTIFCLKGLIHTPMPATPLCTLGEISIDLVDPSIFQDPKRRATVAARTTIVRDFLFQGGELYIIYPKVGFIQRTKAQQDIYLKELEIHSDHLFDCPLESEPSTQCSLGRPIFLRILIDKSGFLPLK